MKTKGLAEEDKAKDLADAEGDVEDEGQAKKEVEDRVGGQSFHLIHLER